MDSYPLINAASPRQRSQSGRRFARQLDSSDVKGQKHLRSLHNDSAETLVENITNSQHNREYTPPARLGNRKHVNETPCDGENNSTCLLCHQSQIGHHLQSLIPPHASEHGRCIEHGWQLCLRGRQPIISSNGDSQHQYFGPPSREALEKLYHLSESILNSQKCQRDFKNWRYKILGRRADRSRTNQLGQNLHIKLRNEHDDLFDIWNTQVANCLMKPYRREITDAIDGLISKGSASIGCIDFAKLSENRPDDELISPAMEMAKIFMFMRNIARAKIHVKSGDIDIGKSILFLILIVCVSKLVELSHHLSCRLVKAIRQAFSQEQSQASYPLDPVCVATGLYEQVVEGLMELHENEVIGLLLEGIEDHIQDLQERLDGILEFMISTNHTRNKTLRLLQDVIPKLPPCRRFSIALWVDSGPNAEEEVFRESSYNIEGLLDVNSCQSSHVQNQPDEEQSRPSRARNRSLCISSDGLATDWLIFSSLIDQTNDY